MFVSRADAIELLRGFEANSSKLFAVLGTGFGTFSFECCITERTPDTLILKQHREQSEDPSNPTWIVSLNEARAFSYGDIREVPLGDRDFLQKPFGKIVGVLTVYFSDTDKLVIVEYSEDEVES